MNIYDAKVFKRPFSQNSNIASYNVIDTEYQGEMSLHSTYARLGKDPDYVDRGEFVNFFHHLRKEIFESDNEDMRKHIQKPSAYKSKVIHLRINNKIRNEDERERDREVKLENLDELVKSDIKLQPSILISVQIKNALSEEQGRIYLSSTADHTRELFLEDLTTEEKAKYPKYQVFESDCILIEDYANKDVKVEIERFDEYEIFAAESKDLATYTMIFGVFFGIVDILKVFKGRLYEDVLNLILKKKLVHEKRLRGGGKYGNQARPSWIIKINDLPWKVEIKIVDAVAAHGMVSLGDFLINSGIENEHKKLLDDYKPRMMEALLYEPLLFHNYSLGDLKLVDGLNAYNANMRDIWKMMGVEDYFKEVKLTIGSTCNDMIEAKIYNLMGVSASQKDNMKKADKDYFCADHTLLASPWYLQRYDVQVDKSLCDTNSRVYNRFLLSKVDGGRCHSYLQSESISSNDYTICDIDISGAYTSIISNLPLYVGSPVIHIYPKQKQFVLRKFLKIYKKELGDNNYYMRVFGKLEFEQDVIASWMDAHKGVKFDDGEDDEEDPCFKLDLKSTNNRIITKEIDDGAITPQILDLIISELSPKHRDDFLDNLYVKAFIFYPPTMEISNVEEYKEKLAAHKNGEIEGTYDPNNEFLDTEYMNPCHYHYKIDYGKFIIDRIRTYRSINKKKKIDSMQKLFKLIGNTTYGVSVSSLFPMSNVVFANNITAAVRCCIWYAEKALNLRQTITDGGIFDMNKVPYPIYKKFDSTQFVRGYTLSNRELTNKYKWKIQPISKNKKPIVYDEGKGWLIDDIYYKTTEDYSKITNKLALEHIQNVFSNNKLMNDKWRHLAVDADGFVIHDNGTPTYDYKKGAFILEVKDFISWASFSGQSNYKYVNFKDKATTKNRSYETKKNDDGTLRKAHTACYLDKKGLIRLDDEFYKYTSPAEMVLDSLRRDNTRVHLIPPFYAPIILKSKDWIQSYRKTYKFSALVAGSTAYKLVIKPLFELSTFKFQTKKQYKAWKKVHDSMKRRYCLTFEHYFMNVDGTCNVKKMNTTIDKMIMCGVTDPKSGNRHVEGLDGNRSLVRNMSARMKVYVDTVLQARRYLRYCTVGKTKFLMEHAYKKDKFLEAAIYDDEIDYYQTDKHSQVDEYEHYDLKEI
jgi:hypothetical protein